MNFKEKRNRRRQFFFIIFMAVFCGLIYTMFVFYSRELDEKFLQMEQETITAYSLQQSRQVRTKLSSIETRMGGVAAQLDFSAIAQEDERLNQYLDKMNENLDYRVRYLTTDSMERQLENGERSIGQSAFLEKILKGENAVSDIIGSEESGQYGFYMGYPVVRDGKTVGMFLCEMKVGILMAPAEHSSFYSVELAAVVDETGNILYCEQKPEWIGGNLYQVLDVKDIPERTLKQLPEVLSEDLDATLLLSEKKGEHFLSSMSLGIRQWNLVQFYSVDALNVISGDLLHNAVTMGLSLVALTLTAGIMVFLMMEEEKKRNELEQARYAALANFSDTVLFEYDHKADELHFTSNVEDLLALDKDTIQRLHETAPRYFHPGDVKAVLDFFKDGWERQESAKLEARIKNRNGSYSWCELSLRPIMENDCVMIGKMADITEQKEKEFTLMSQKRSDPLTGLLNREAFSEAVDTLLAKGQSGFLFMLDVDNFKSVNDTLGHENGDRLLMRISCLLKQSFREYDLVGRFGGDEFVAFLSSSASRDIAGVKAGMILSKMEEFLTVDSVKVSVSIGIAAGPEDGASFAELFRNADRAMYEAKNRGKNQFLFYSELTAAEKK